MQLFTALEILLQLDLGGEAFSEGEYLDDEETSYTKALCVMQSFLSFLQSLDARQLFLRCYKWRKCQYQRYFSADISCFVRP